MVEQAIGVAQRKHELRRSKLACDTDDCAVDRSLALEVR
jgi:hypothetical protein